VLALPWQIEQSTDRGYHRLNHFRDMLEMISHPGTIRPTPGIWFNGSGAHMENEKCEVCQCAFWANHDLPFTVLTGHHPECRKGPDAMTAAKDLLRTLTKGMEFWAAQEDGIPEEIWEAYARAKMVIGERVELCK
jgi:hypothetical protein